MNRLSLLPLLLLPFFSHATVGGPETVEILGERDNRLYLAHRVDDAAERPATVYVYDLRQAQPPARVDPVSRTGGRAQVEAGILALKKTLRPLKTLTFDSVGLSVKVAGREPGPYGIDQAHSEVLDVTISHGTVSRTVRGYAWPGARGIVAAGQASTGHVITIFRSMGLTFETGYELDTPVLLPPPGKSLPSPKHWTAVCKRTTACTVTLDGEIAIQAAPGTLRCAEAGAWLGCLWRGRGRNPGQRGWFVDRRTAELRSFGVAPEWGWRIDGPPKIDGDSLVYRVRSSKGKRQEARRRLPPTR
jgi:hypothetical protein